MVERCQKPRFALEPRQPPRIGGEIFGKRLDRDLATELGVTGSPHFAHAAFAELGRDLVVGELFPDHRNSRSCYGLDSVESTPSRACVKKPR